MEGVIDVEMRNSEMRRILSQDPKIVKALAKIEEDQRIAGNDTRLSSIRVAQPEQPPEKLISTVKTDNVTTEA